MKIPRVLLIALTVAFAIFIPRAISPGHAVTIWTVNSGQSTSTIQGVSNGASAGDMVVFSAGTYNFTGQLTLKCGVTYTGPVATPVTAILNGSGAGIGAGNGLFTLFSGSGLANPCTQPTTIEYLNFHAVDTGIYVETSFTNLNIVHNQCTSIPGRTSQTACIVFASGNTTSNTAATLSNTTVSYNQMGDSNSCVSPTNVMTDTDSPEDYEGACNGMVFFTSINGLTVTNNSFFHIAEGTHINCPNYASQQYECEPPGGAITKNIVVEFNDFSNIHRINWEQQPQQNSGEIWEYNTSHDWFDPYFGSYGLSMACCYNGTSLPNTNASNNVVIFNVGAGANGRYGYGMEAMGKNATFDHELLQAAASSSNAPGMAWGCGNVSSMSNNTVQGNFGGYIVSEGSFPCGTVTTPTLSGNVTGATVSAITSVAPTLPPSGFMIGNITVTDPGFTSGPQPLGNTSIYCTTDGSTPTVSSPLYTGPLAVVYPVTVKCIGMWGTGANTRTYQSGYGFVPSTVVSASYTSAAAAATPAFSPASSSFATSLSVSISDATIGATIYYTTDGTTPTTSSSVYTAPITVTGASTVIKAIATHPGNSQSAIATATYISTTVVSTPTFSPSSESFSGTVSVSISDLTPSSTIYYTTDGSTPTTSGGGGSGATYYISPSGSDSNAGTSSGSPWLTPNHPVNCGDTVLAASGTYSSANFQNSKWGTSTCAAGNNVAWLKCATFDTCKINSTTGTAPGLWIDKSYWGVQGWEVSVGSGVTFGTCFEAGSATTSNVVHHIVFANNIANGCQNGGFVTFNDGTTGGVDYVAMIGNIAYNAAQGSHSCTSGFSVYQPIASDTNAGTHFFIAGNFSYANVDPATCNGTPSTDGEAVIIDTLDFSQASGTPYTQQVAVENNIGFFNGGRGFEVFNNQAGSTHAPVFFRYNTAFGDMTDLNQTAGCLGRAELAVGYAKRATYDHNLAQTRTGNSCSSAPLYGLTIETGDGSDVATNNWYSGTSGNNTLIDSSSGFSLGGTNTVGTNPAFTNPVNPGAPSCGSYASVPACMATVVTDYTPTTSGASAYGYQVPVSGYVADALFPSWLCNTNLPAGLVSSPCSSGGSGGGSTVYSGPFSLSATTTVKAIAAASGLTTSAVGSATYTLVSGGGGGGPTVVNTPFASPAAGNYFATQSVTLSDSTPGATICYTLDGSAPAALVPGVCSSGTTYSGAISVSSSETINALGTLSGDVNSAVVSFSYSISAPTPSQRGNIDYTQIKVLERLGPGNMFQMVNLGTYSAVNTATPCNSTNQGATAFVLDSTTATYGASISGGGGNKVHALCNGAAWVVD